MGRGGKNRIRKVNTREERKTVADKSLLTFSFKHLDQTQPKQNPETIALWQELGLYPKLIERLKQLSTLSRDEACKQQQIKLYGDFPPENKTKFYPPSYIDSHVAWGVIEGLGGLPRVAGYLIENTFYVVFFDSKHQFWLSEKKHT